MKRRKMNRKRGMKREMKVAKKTVRFQRLVVYAPRNAYTPPMYVSMKTFELKEETTQREGVKRATCIRG